MAVDWCPFAIKRPIVSSNYASGRGSQVVTAVVMHIAAGTMASVFPTFNTLDRKTSAHFCIGKDGALEQYVSVNDTAYGNGLAWKDGQWYNSRSKVVNPTWSNLIAQTNPNAYTVSIEHEGQPADEWTADMYRTNNRLLVWLGEQFSLMYNPHHSLIGHCEIDPLDKPNCPGPNVNYERIATDACAILVGKKLAWVPINEQAALFRFAQANKLGYPQTDEFETQVTGVTYLAQVFNLGIVYAKKGDWANIKWTKKT
jgi:N-acetyl-anhydromuramyl-L-alanine amidase AmpD